MVVIDGELASRRGGDDQDARLLHLLDWTVENTHRRRKREGKGEGSQRKRMRERERERVRWRSMASWSWGILDGRFISDSD